MTESTNDLQALTACGFEFAHPRDAWGDLVAVVGIRVLGDAIDVLKVFGDDAEALRVPSDEADMLAPGRVLWRAAGSTGQVIDEIRNLDGAGPRPRTPGSSTQPAHTPTTQATGYWPTTPAQPADRLATSA